MPTRDTAWAAGTPCWVDYSAADIEAAKAFYTSVIGWDYSEGREDFGGYVTALRSDRNAAGLMPTMSAEQPSAWTTYFATDDAEATAAAITANGGTVIAGRHEVGTLGVMVIGLDPQGIAFGAWQARDHTGFQIYNEPGSVVWNEGAMPDTDAARTFYSAVFGLRFDEMEGATDYATFSTGGDMLGGLGAQEPGAPQGWMVCFSVASTDNAAAAAEAAGGKIHTAPQDTPYGRFAVIEDPWGAAFELMQVQAEG
jgi:predicted enzyme related to lactoylglutathione lyase